MGKVSAGSWLSAGQLFRLVFLDCRGLFLTTLKNINFIEMKVGNKHTDYTIIMPVTEGTEASVAVIVDSNEACSARSGRLQKKLDKL